MMTEHQAMAFSSGGAKRHRMGYYEAGHKMYIHRASHEKFKKDIAAFIQQGSKE